MKTGENENKFITEDSVEKRDTHNQKTSKEYYDSVDRYLDSISKFKILSQEEVIKLYQDLFSKDEIIERKAREILINCNLKLVWSLVKKILRSTHHPFFLDAIAEGNLALIEKVIPNFDPNMGYQFSSYAVPVIKEAIRKAVVSNNMPIIKKGSAPGFAKVTQVFQELKHQNKFAITLENLNKELKKRNIREITKATFNALFVHTEQGKLLWSLDEKPENGLSKYEITEDPRASQDFADIERRKDFEKLLEIIRESNLTVEEKFLLIDYYLGDKNYRELGKKYGFSYETVRTTINKVKEKIKKILNSKGLTMADFF